MNIIKRGEVNGLPFLIKKQELGFLCGYVGVPSGSILDGETYYFFNFGDGELTQLAKAINDIEVHGGLTFAGRFSKNDDWYFGFDCSHLGDKTDLSITISDGENDVYRDEEYVMAEIKKLSKQLNDILEKV